LSQHIRGPTLRAQIRASIRAHNAQPYRPANVGGRARAVPRYILFLCLLASGGMVIGGRCLGGALSGRPQWGVGTWAATDGQGLPMWTPKGEPNGGRNWASISREVWTAKGAADFGRPPKRGWRWDVADHFGLTGRPTWTGLAVRRGGRWAAIVDLSGCPHWTKVGAPCGGMWAATVGPVGRLTWGQVDADCGSPLGRGWWPNVAVQMAGDGRRMWAGLGAHFGTAT